LTVYWYIKNTKNIDQATVRNSRRNVSVLIFRAVHETHAREKIEAGQNKLLTVSHVETWHPSSNGIMFQAITLTGWLAAGWHSCCLCPTFLANLPETIDWRAQSLILKLELSRS